MKFFDNALNKIRNDKRWFTGTLAVLVTAFVAVLITLFMLPEAKANAIVDDVANKTMTYNIPAIVAQATGAEEVIEVEVNIDDPDYKYYIVGDTNTYDDVTIVVNYNLSVSKAVPVYLDNVKIEMSKNYPILEFKPSTNETTNVDGSYQVIVKGDCEFTSTCAQATYPVVQVEAIHAELYELVDYKGDQIQDITNFYTMTETNFDIAVEFTSYDFPNGEPKTNCSLEIVTAGGSYGAGIGTTSGDINISADNLTLADGSGNTIDDIGGQLAQIFGHPLKPGKQAFYDTYGYCGDITVSGELKLTIEGNGYGACIGGGGAMLSTSTPKAAGKVNIKGGTLYLSNHDMSGYAVPVIGGGASALGNIGANNAVVITGGSIYIEENGIEFGAADAYPVNSAGERLYRYTANYLSDIDENGKLIIANDMYEESYKADLSVIGDYVDVDLEYNSSDMSQVLTYNYDGFGHGLAALDTNLYFYLPASPLCSIVIDGSSYIKADIPTFDLSVAGNSISPKDEVYWMPAGSEVVIAMENMPSYIDIKEIILTDINTGIPTDYTAALEKDAAGNYTVKVNVGSNYSVKVLYSSNITLEYDNAFLEGDSHNVQNNSPLTYELGDIVALDKSYVICEDLIFEGWVSALTGESVDEISPANLDSIMDSTGVISLKAKWSVLVEYDADGGEATLPSEDYLEYGKETDLVITSTEPTLENYIFEGWMIEGDKCAPGYIYTFTPTKNTIITAVYIQSNFFVYIDAGANKFNIENVDIFAGLKGTTVSEENNLLAKNPDGSYMTKEIGGVNYYYAIVENESEVAIILTQKPGHIITGQSITIREENGSQIVVGTSGGEDGEIRTEFVINEDNVFISTPAEFVLREYNITFYDGTTASGGSELWPTDSFTYTIAELDKSLDEILGSRAAELSGVRNRFYEFTCWKDMLTGKTYTNADALKENLGDVILVAQWSEIEKYPVCVEVIDENNGEISQDVLGIPYYENASGVLEEAYSEEVNGEKIYYAATDDKVVIKFFYYDNAGVLKDVTGAVALEGMVLKYVKSTGSNTTEEIAEGVNYFVCPQPLADTKINVRATISIQRYTIEYWDTKDTPHDNPTTYTFFDEIVLDKLYDNVGWMLVTADKDDSNYDEVKLTPITKIERGTVGNIVLKADWSNFIKTSYIVQVDSNVKNGILEIVYPTERDFYVPNETLIIKALPNKGYVLKDNIISYKDMYSMMTMSSLISGYGLKNETTLFDGTVQITGSDGIYLVNMPEKNIVISAVFELEQYSIKYKNVEGLKNNNATSYTYFDTITLLPVTKAGYEFVGWKDANGNVISKISGETGNLELWAVFEEIEESTEDESNSADNSKEENTTSEEDQTTNGVNNAPTSDKNNPQPEENQTTISDDKVSIVDKDDVNGQVGGDDQLETETQKTHLVGGGNAYGSSTYTGDKTNVTRLVLICVAAVLAVAIAVVYKGDKSDDDDKN